MKYVGVKTDENLNWEQQISDVATKLNRGNAIQTKLKHFIDRKTLKSIFDPVFGPHLCHSSLVWAQNSNPVLLCKKILADHIFLKS